MTSTRIHAQWALAPARCGNAMSTCSPRPPSTASVRWASSTAGRNVEVFGVTLDAGVAGEGVGASDHERHLGGRQPLASCGRRSPGLWVHQVGRGPPPSWFWESEHRCAARRSGVPDACRKTVLCVEKLSGPAARSAENPHPIWRGVRRLRGPPEHRDRTEAPLRGSSGPAGAAARPPRPRRAPAPTAGCGPTRPDHRRPKDRSSRRRAQERGRVDHPRRADHRRPASGPAPPRAGCCSTPRAAGSGRRGSPAWPAPNAAPPRARPAPTTPRRSAPGRRPGRRSGAPRRCPSRPRSPAGRARHRDSSSMSVALRAASERRRAHARPPRRVGRRDESRPAPASNSSRSAPALRRLARHRPLQHHLERLRQLAGGSRAAAAAPTGQHRVQRRRGVVDVERRPAPLMTRR